MCGTPLLLQIEYVHVVLEYYLVEYLSLNAKKKNNFQTKINFNILLFLIRMFPFSVPFRDGEQQIGAAKEWWGRRMRAGGVWKVERIESCLPNCTNFIWACFRVKVTSTRVQTSALYAHKYWTKNKRRTTNDEYSSLYLFSILFSYFVFVSTWVSRCAFFFCARWRTHKSRLCKPKWDVCQCVRNC